MIRRYPPAALAVDYLRAAVGAGVCGAPLALGGTPTVVAALCTAGVALFALYAATTVARQRLRLRVDDEGIGGFGRDASLAWSDIERVRLAYYSVRRDGRDGWMELRIDGAGGRLRIDSRLEGFPGIAARAARAALARGAELDPATCDNLARLDEARDRAGPRAHGVAS